jgi:hypothetical protein
VGRLGRVEVLVPENQAAAARDLLKAMESGEFENLDFDVPENNS